MWKLYLCVVCIGILVQEGQAQNSCPTPNGYFADPQQCDAYFECKEGASERKLCPDGLFFDDRHTHYPRYPCAYPQEVQCGSRTRTQPPQSTGNCPHQYGFYRMEAGPEKCGSYVNCVGGQPYIHQCPEGLAFNVATIQCDWPDQVPDCDADRFLRFQCPGVRVEADLGHPRYADPADCRKFYVCIENVKPRALSCQLGSVFNPDLGICDEPQNVPKCQNYYPRAVLDALQQLKSYDNKL